MTKKELSDILNSVDGVTLVAEGEPAIEQKGGYPRIVYWETVWTDHNASGDDYETTVTYQVSYCDRKPRGRGLLRLKAALNKAGLHPTFYHEHVVPTDSPQYFHSYCAVDVEEDLDDE